MILLGKIDGIFTISGRGVIVTPELSDSLDPELKFSHGDKIELRRADGFVVETAIRGIEFLTPLVRRKPVNIGLLLPPDINHDDLSKGMEIWLSRSA